MPDVEDVPSPAPAADAPPEATPPPAPAAQATGTSTTTDPVDRPNEQPTPPAQPNPPVTFTPEQQKFLDAQIGQARIKGRDAAYNYAFRELGVKDLGEAKTLIAQARGAATERDAKLAETQAALDELRTTHEGKVGELDQQLTVFKSEALTWKQKAERALRVAEVKLAAKNKGFTKPEDALAFVQLDSFPVDLEKQTVDGIEAAIDAVATERPYLLSAARTESAAPPPLPATPAPADPAAALTEAELTQARNSMRAVARRNF